MTITHYVDPLGIQFIDFSGNYSLKYDIPQINISPEYVQSKDFILGLNFILGLQGAITITKNYITLSKHIYSIPTLRYTQTSELAQKRGGLGTFDFLRQTHPKTKLQIENDTLKPFLLCHIPKAIGPNVVSRYANISILSLLFVSHNLTTV